ncbi:putative protein kinase RLK-Pelle-LRR-IX family [Rosa chinensis]|uniref:Protein kinase domain-containing protein n=1 Tax=Rosa chinensis TaxID=74649 RepID=A0A2P6PCU0_ROSCH|nr:putative protein kinase RLK-Pelle-LRR-IX family [Rosa chinensis]
MSDNLNEIPLQVLRDATSDFSTANLLGRGGFSSVFKGIMEDSSMRVVKKMETKHYDRLDAKALKSFNSEIRVLNSVRHANLVTLIGYYQDEEHLILVYEYMSHGTLRKHMFNWRDEAVQTLDWGRRLNIALNIAREVEHIHKFGNKKLVHRYLKPTNILLGEDFTAKVADFGLVCLCSLRDRYSSPLSQPTGTPKCLRGSVIDKANVYSFELAVIRQKRM